jgi:hypothetical protein
MKFHSISIALFLFSAGSMLSAQTPGLRGTDSISIQGKKISVEYGRPSLDGRDMLGRATAGMVWRMGQDAATTLTTEAELDFNGQKVAPGRYLLAAVKTGDRQWSLIINSDSSKSAFSRDPSEDVAEVGLESSVASEPVETFTISLEDGGDGSGSFTMAWGDLIASAQFTVR